MFSRLDLVQFSSYTQRIKLRKSEGSQCIVNHFLCIASKTGYDIQEELLECGKERCLEAVDVGIRTQGERRLWSLFHVKNNTANGSSLPDTYFWRPGASALAKSTVTSMETCGSKVRCRMVLH